MAVFSEVQKAVELLLQGELVALPTETVYGLGGNALDAGVVAKIFEAKNRPSFDPLIVHVASVDQAGEIAEITEEARLLFERFSPGPLTLVLKKKDVVPDLVTSGHSTVAVRIPNHAKTIEVIRKSGLCIAAPSANPFGYTSPTTAQHVEEQLGAKIGGILDGGPATIGLESTIVDASGAGLKVLRLGGLPYEEICKALGKEIPVQTSSSKPNAPGMLSSHYNPGVPIKLFEDADALWIAYSETKATVGVLYMGESRSLEFERNLSEGEDLREVAAGLFAGLRELAKEAVEEIWTYKMPEVGLGRAINDRLIRAAISV